MENENEKKNSSSGMEKIASFIVDRRNLFFLIYIFALVFSVFSMQWVKVENDITTYLPSDTETRQGLTIMDENFITYGSSRVMVSNVSYEKSIQIKEYLEEIEGVTSVEFDNSKSHYINGSALYSISFDGTASDEISKSAMEKIREYISNYDAYVDTEVGVDASADLASEMVTIVAVAALIIVIVLILTSRAYAEVPVLIMTFGVAALLNMGTNFLCGTISFISNSVTVVLQLALAIDYAIILCHRFSDEHETLPAREACIKALSKAIPEISSSSLTTISGLAALAFMHFGIGIDLATVLIKAIFCSLLSVFTLMPGLLMLFSKLIDKSQHKNLLPKISAVGKFANKSKYIIPPVFLVVIVIAAYFSNQCPYVYTYNDLTTAKASESQIAKQSIKANFGNSNMLAINIPKGFYDKEKQVLAQIDKLDGVKKTQGLANIEAMDGYMLADALNPREFSELTGVDIEVSKLLYSAYALDNSQYGQIINGIGNVDVPLFDMFMFLKQEMDDGNIYLDSTSQEKIDNLFDQLEKAQLQLQSDDYSRLVVYLDLPEESEQTTYVLDEIHDILAKYYDGGYYVVGNSTSAVDLASSFIQDNTLISVLSALFVIIILLFTFQSAGLPVLLIIVIQGSIWINFAFPALQNDPLYFLGYLIVNAIQMGANIDYAIVISSHYAEYKHEMKASEAIVESLNSSFPTIFTSGSILASAGILISKMTTNPVIAAIGTCLGRGTIISIVLVFFVLPQILVLGDSIIERTSFKIETNLGKNMQSTSGTIALSGRIRGKVDGFIDGDFKGVIRGSLNALVLSKDEINVTNEGGQDNEENN